MDGKQSKIAGINQVLWNCPELWQEKVLEHYKAYLEIHAKVTAEDARFACEAKVGPPNHHNAWSAIWYKVVAKGWVVFTGETVLCAKDSSNERRLPVYKSLLHSA